MVIDIDYSGAGVPIVTGFVSDGLSKWYESVQLIGYYCDDEDHEGEPCVCGSDDELYAAFGQNLSSRGLKLVCDMCQITSLPPAIYLGDDGMCFDCTKNYEGGY